MTIIGMSGYGYTGKDTVGGMLNDLGGFIRIAFADALKDCVLALNPLVDPLYVPPRRVKDLHDSGGWDEAKKNPEVRRLLQRMGTEVGRQILDPDIWVKVAFHAMRPYKARGHRHFVITDCRFTNEARAVKDAGGLMVRIERPDYGPVNNHSSETELDDWEFDLTIANDGTLDDLRDKVTVLLSITESLAPR